MTQSMVGAACSPDVTADDHVGAVSLAPDERNRVLQVRFFRTQDRFCHCVAVVVGQQVNPVLYSVEGDSQSDWPPSPPCQQLSFEPRRDEQTVALSVGMAGRSHWSMSVAPAGGEPAAWPAIEFDVACRTNRAPDWLGNRYRISAGSRPAFADPTRVCVAGVQIELVDGGSDVTLIADPSSEQLVVARHCKPCTMPATFRWRYRVVLLDE